MQSLFVYGTLRPNQPNAHVMERIGGHWKAGYIRGHLKQRGWGAQLGSPGVQLSTAGETVQGYVFFSENLHQYWDELDAFEGEEYQRVPVQVYLEEGGTLESLVYALKDEVK